MVIQLGSLFISLCHFWNWIDALLSPPNIFDAFHFCMLGNGPLEGLIRKSLDVRKKGLGGHGQIVPLMVDWMMLLKV
jgi:hypothetical protein